jgi:hypothetical protein
MLLRPLNRPLLLPLAWAFALTAWGQVQVDRPVVLAGSADSLRRITGLTMAMDETALITAGEAVQGTVHLALSSGSTNTVALTLSPPALAYTSGMTIRWNPHVVSAGGLVKVNVDGLGDRSVYRNDGLPVAFGQLQPGSVAEIIYADTAFFLTGRTRSDCPTGFVEVSSELCIQQNDSTLIDVFSAVVYCRQRGARLCTWDEYVLACSAQGQQLSGMFDDWEWIDDTSDHTHTGNQAGRYSCRSHRALSADLNPNSVGVIRCCYRKP